MNSILTLAPTVLAFLALCGVIGGFMAMKQGYFQQSASAQAQAIAAQTAQIEALKAQVITLKESLQRLKQVVITIQRLEEKRGVAIDINGEFVTLVDEGNKRERTLRIRIDDGGTGEASAL